MAMKKYKIALGICGTRVLYSKPTRAFDERNAVVKYLLAEGKDPTEEEIGKLIHRVVEHVPRPRKKRTADEREPG